MADLPTVTIYSDGGASPNPGIGGWAAILLYNKEGEAHSREISGRDASTTNNRMELTAAIEALRTLKRPCHVEFYTDSEYVKNGITTWIINWKRTNFKGGTIKNVDLWKTLDEEVSRHQITWHWVKGHAGDQYNERVDQLVGEARQGNLHKP